MKTCEIASIAYKKVLPPITFTIAMKLEIEKIAELLPSVRAKMARELANSYKLNQTEISNMLGVTQPAVSQYLRQIRGANKMMSDQNLAGKIRQLCEQLINGKIDKPALETELYSICRFLIKQNTKTI